MEDGEITLATVRCAKNCTCNDIMSMDNQHPAITPEHRACPRSSSHKITSMG